MAGLRADDLIAVNVVVTPGFIGLDVFKCDNN
jgi:hypothetical protein